MPQAPHVTAIVDIDDRLTPGLEKIIAELDRVAKSAGEKIGTGIEPALAKIDDKFKLLGETAKQALNPAMVKDFAGQLGIVSTEVGKLNSSLARTKEHTHGLRGTFREMAEFAKVMAGFEGMRLFGEGIRSGADLNEVKAEMKAAGIPLAEQDHMLKGARSIAAGNVMTTQAEVLRTATEIRGEIVPHGESAGELTEESLRLAKLAADANKALKASGVADGFSSTDLKNLVKFSESAGEADNPKFMQRLIESYVKTKQVDRGFIDTGKYFDYIVNAKASGLSLNEDFLTKTLPVLLAMGQAPRLGNETAQAMKTLTGGNVLKGTALWLQDMGLVDPGQLRKTGPGTYAITGGVRDSATLMTDPNKWAIDTLLPALLSHGIKPENIAKQLQGVLSEDEMAKKSGAVANAQSLMQSSMRATVVDFFTHLVENAEVIEKNKEKVQHALGLNAQDLVGENATAGLEQFKKSWENLMGVLTDPLMADAAKSMEMASKGISNMSKSLSDAFDKNPILGKAVGGAATLGAGAATAWLFTGVTGLVNSGPQLQTAATQLQVAAKELQGAAASQGGKGPGGKDASSGLGWGRLLTGALTFLSFGATAPKSEQEFYQRFGSAVQDRKAFNDWVHNVAPWTDGFFNYEQNSKRDDALIKGADRYGAMSGTDLETLRARSRAMARADTLAELADWKQSQTARTGNKNPYIFDPESQKEAYRNYTMNRGGNAPQAVTVSGQADVRQQTHVTVELGQKTTTLIEKAVRVGLTTDPSKVGTAQPGPEPGWHR